MNKNIGRIECSLFIRRFAVAFDFAQETAETRRLIEEFKAAYVDGEDDEFLKNKASEIFGRLKAEDRSTASGSAGETEVRQRRKEFAKFVAQVCDNRGEQATAELGKYFTEYKRNHSI